MEEEARQKGEGADGGEHDGSSDAAAGRQRAADTEE